MLSNRMLHLQTNFSITQQNHHLQLLKKTVIYNEYIIHIVQYSTYSTHMYSIYSVHTYSTYSKYSTYNIYSTFSIYSTHSTYNVHTMYIHTCRSTLCECNKLTCIYQWVH